jgi:hypothetical protein
MAYAMSMGLMRRDLTPSQRAMIAARARELYDKQAKERQQAGGGDKKSASAKSGVANLPPPIQDPGKARDLAGKAAGVSGRTVDHATKVLKHAVPEVVQAVDECRMAVTTAARLASEPEEVQHRRARALYQQALQPERDAQLKRRRAACRGLGQEQRRLCL